MHVSQTHLHRTGILLALLALAATLTGCSAGRLSQKNYAILQSDSRAAMDRLSQIEPTFDGLVQTSVAYAVFPGGFNGVYYLLGAGGGRGLLYDASGSVLGYSRQIRLNAGLGLWIEYADLVIFFRNEQALERFQQGGWSLGGELAAGFLGWGASGQTTFTRDHVIVGDPRASLGLGAFFTIDNFSYRDIDEVLQP